jgi:hypothetical protein
MFDSYASMRQDRANSSSGVTKRMPISASCAHCSRVIYAAEEEAGKAKPCPGCGQMIIVPTEISNAVEKPVVKNCPQCGTKLKLVRKYHGKNVRCNTCGTELAVWADPWRLLVVGIPAAQPFDDGASHIEDHASIMNSPPMAALQGSSASGLTTAAPPAQMASRTAESWHPDAPVAVQPPSFSDGAPRLTFSDMFLGQEKEDVFQLLSDEELLSEITIHHKHFAIIDKGITRLALTNQRLLYTRTSVFSPLYWLLLIFFWPLIFYYAIRIARNRNGAIPLSSVDSIEKRYFPNWFLFLAALLIGSIVVWLCNTVVGLAAARMIGESATLQLVLGHLLEGLLALSLLMLLLSTRGPWMEVRSGNNHFPIIRRPGDVGGTEEELDTFFQKANAQVQLAKMLR